MLNQTYKKRSDKLSNLLNISCDSGATRTPDPSRMCGIALSNWACLNVIDYR